MTDFTNGQRQQLAIAAAACRLPGGINDMTGLHHALMDGQSLITDVPPTRWSVDFHDPTGYTAGTTCTHRGSFLESTTDFDANFFGVGEQEAESMDPQQRILLEVSWEAMRQVDPDRNAWHRSRTGVYVGLLAHDYRSLHLEQGGVRSIGAHYAPGNEASFAAGRVAFHFDLAGPAIGVSTACSSSLVALSLAADALLLGHIDRAVVAGVNLLLSPELSIYMSRIGALSPTGDCQPFRVGADGVLRGDGCAAIVLARENACSGPLALIRGYGTNNDGLSAGLTAPSARAQSELIRQVWTGCGLEGTDIDFAEMHGTGTPLGDPVEASALSTVIEATRSIGHPLPIGSHKANFGHLDAVAGMVGLLKAILVTRTGSIPPQPAGSEPCDLGPYLTLATEPIVLAPRGRPIRSTVSAFGLSGTNAHIVVEAVDAITTHHNESCLLLLSGNSEANIAEYGESFDQASQNNDPEEIAWRARSTVAGPHGAWRTAFTVDTDGTRHPLIAGHVDANRPRPVIVVVLSYGASASQSAIADLRHHPMWHECAQACAAATGMDLEQATVESTRSYDAARILTTAYCIVRMRILTDLGLVVDDIVGEDFLTSVSLDTHRDSLENAFKVVVEESGRVTGATTIVAESATWVENHLNGIGILLSDRGSECVVACLSRGMLEEMANICDDTSVALHLVDGRFRPSQYDASSLRDRVNAAQHTNPNAIVIDLSCRLHHGNSSSLTLHAGTQSGWADQAVASAWAKGATIRLPLGRIGQSPTAGGERLPPMRWTRKSYWSPVVHPPSRDDSAKLTEVVASNALTHDDQLESKRPRRDEVSGVVDEALAAALVCTAANLPGQDEPLFDAGLSSLSAVAAVEKINHTLGVVLPTTIILETPTRNALIQAVDQTVSRDKPIGQAHSHRLPEVAINVSEHRRECTSSHKVAVIAHSYRLPSATDDDELWELLKAGAPMARPPTAGRPGTTSWKTTKGDVPRLASYLDDIDFFDAKFFSMSPAEARWVDPQHRLLLEASWEALSRSGARLLKREEKHRTGVFIGLDSSDYGQLAANNDNTNTGFAYYGTGNSPAAASGRISYAFDLGGPSLTLDTACSSSLTAIHTASRSLTYGECDHAVVGAANLIVSPTISTSMTQAGALSPDGQCKAFARLADGYGRGDGIIVVILKRLGDALREGDRVEAVIEGSALVHDGRSGGFTVPSIDAQERVIREALHSSGRTAGEVTALEAHGTGTSLGDPLELRALTRVFENNTLIIGTAKNVFGHLEAAAGLLGLLKVILCLQRGEYPKHPLPGGATSEFDWERDTVKVSHGIALGNNPVIGISSFGFTGTNGHLIVSRNQSEAIPSTQPRNWLLPVSGHTAQACYSRLRDIANAATSWKSDELAGALAVLSRVPRHLRYRICLSSSSAQDLLEQLSDIRRGAPFPEPVATDVANEYIDLDDQSSEIASHFVEGATLTWHAGRTMAAPVLPPYPFERSSHWLTERTQSMSQRQDENNAPASRGTTSAHQSAIVPDTPSNLAIDIDEYISSIADVFTDLLEMTPDDVDTDLGLFDLGVDSIQAVAICDRLSEIHNVDIDPTATFEYSTVRRLAAYIADLITTKEASQTAIPDQPSNDQDNLEEFVDSNTSQSPALATLEAAMQRANALLDKGIAS